MRYCKPPVKLRSADRFNLRNENGIWTEVWDALSSQPGELPVETKVFRVGRIEGYWSDSGQEQRFNDVRKKAKEWSTQLLQLMHYDKRNKLNWTSHDSPQ